MTSYLEAIKPYLLPSGIMTLTDPAEPTDNPILYTATHLYVLRRLGIGTWDAHTSAYLYLLERFKASGRGLPLPEKSWGHGNFSHDELIGWSSIDRIQAENAFNSGQPFWIYNATGDFLDNFRGWYWRLPHVPAFIRAAAGREVPAIEQIRYARDLKRVKELPVGEASKRCLYLLQSQYVKQFPARMADAMWEFLIRSDVQYGDLAGLYETYFRPSHPFARYTQGLRFYERQGGDAA